MSGGRLLMLHDSEQFGGHEIMLLNLLPGVIEAGGFDEIVACFPAANNRLAASLAALGPAVRLSPWPFLKRRGEPYLAFARRRYAAAVRRIVADEKPETVLLVQGRIENLVVPMLAVPRGQFLVSYVPMAHSMGNMGRNGWIGDMVRRRLYRRPDRFIVPARSVATQVAEAGGRAPAEVVENFVPPPPLIDRMAARSSLGVPADARIALFMGRLDTVQKGLDRLVAALRRHHADLSGWLFLFVGDGEGRPMLDALEADMERGFAMRILPWTDQPHVCMAAADILLMPSRWEGLPLVMLEAMACDLPVLAADIDIFREYLPGQCLADFLCDDLPARMARLATAEGRATFKAGVAKHVPDPARARARFAAALRPEASRVSAAQPQHRDLAFAGVGA